MSPASPASPTSPTGPTGPPTRLRLTNKAAIDHDLFLSRRDQANAVSILEMTLKARAKNTDKNYIPKQQEFIDWTIKSNYHDRDTVTEAKLLSFLNEEVVHRSLRKKGKKALAADEVELDDQVLKWGSVRAYVTAITDLYNSQKARNMNSNPSPRAPGMRDFIKALQRRDTELAKQNYADKGRDTYLDGYTQDQFKDLCDALWKASCPSTAATTAGGSDAIRTSCHLRTLVDLLLGHYLAARGQDRRVAEISDLHTFEFPDEGPTPCFPLIMTLRGSKTNQHGRLETMGALRNKDLFICPLSALGFYFLYRWDLTEEPFPDFSSRSRWYNTRLLLSSKPKLKSKSMPNGATANDPLSYNAQYDWMARAFAMIGLNSSKVTHLPRGVVVRLAELLGVTEDQIARAGRWTFDQMTGCYLTSLPHEFMRKMAGHPTQRGCFEIRRASITPPDTLLKLIWPKLDQWKGKFGVDGIDDLAASGFCNLLHQLRIVILQDSVALRQAYPDHPIFAHRVFNHKDYRAFAAQVASIIGEDAIPSLSTRLVQAMPDLADRLQSIGSQVVNQSRDNTQIKTIISEMAQDVAATKLDISRTQRTLQWFTSGGLTFRLEMTPQGGQGRAMITPVAAVLPASSPSTSLPSSPSSPPPSPQQSPQQQQQLQQQLQLLQLQQQQLQQQLQQQQSSPIDTARPPLYRMRRDIRTVEQLHREWTQGLQGGPSILELDRQYGARWRSDRRSEIQFYSLRQEIMREISRISSHNSVSEIAAVQRVQGRQDREKWSMDKLCKTLRLEAKQRGQQRA
jgi:Centromere DNA-binding protein complex CBF3 subunit, domain 2/Transcriptional activator of glycolytic enzymes